MSYPSSLADRIPTISGALVVLVSVSVVVGWYVNSPILTGVVPGWATMKINTALAFLLAGLSVIAARATGVVRLSGALFAAGTTILALLSLAEYITGSLGIDEVLATDMTTRLGLPPGRMSPSTAISFIFTGTAMLLLYRRGSHRVVQGLVFPAVFIAFLSFAGYVYNSPAFSRLGPFESMALHTTLLFGVLCTGILFLMPEDGIVALLRLPGASGWAARSLLSMAVLVPLIIGWFRLMGQHLGFYGTEFGVAIFVVTTVTVLVVFICWSITSLSRFETSTEQANLEVRRQRDALKQQAQLINLSKDAIIIEDTGRVIKGWNGGAERLYGWKESEAIGQKIQDLLKPALPAVIREIDAVLCRESRWEGELVYTRRDGVKVTVDSQQVLHLDDADDGGRILEINRDLSDRKHLQEQLLQSQKLESVGQLAGGVAHDFNNLLTVITGYTDIILSDLPSDHPLRESLEEISNAGARASSLTRQLLMFSRHQISSPKNLSLNDTTNDIEKLLRRLINENIQLTLLLDPSTPVIRADRGHIEQVIMNLVINARDAMPDGGKLIIETSGLFVDEHYAATHLSVEQGYYALLTVSDTGTGMSPEVKARIFEPFFTTKDQGKGTGLGLSTVYGIVKQSRGTIFVYSEPGRGTTFRILLPAVEGAVEETHLTAEPEGLEGTETILLVEDEEGLRKYVRDVLERRGYTVLTSTNGQDALNHLREFEEPIHLLLTDVIMPAMGGLDLARQFALLHPNVPVLHMSGYTDQFWDENDGTKHFLQKPFTPGMLLVRVRRLLDEHR